GCARSRRIAHAAGRSPSRVPAARGAPARRQGVRGDRARHLACTREHLRHRASDPRGWRALMSRTQRLWAYAALAALAAVVHDGGHVLRGTAHDVLWMCNVAPVLLAVGSGIRDATLVS